MKLKRVCAKSCQPSRTRSPCGHRGENRWNSQFASRNGLNFKESSSQTWSCDRVSCNSFSVQDPFGFHYSSEEENIDKGIAEDRGLLGNRFCQAQASCRYFKKLIGIFKALRWLFTERTTSHRLKPDYSHQSPVFKCAGSKPWLQSMLLSALGFNRLVQEG